MDDTTVITLNYLDKFGVKKQFVFCDHLNQKSKGQSHDGEVKKHMRKLGIKKCRVAYDDFSVNPWAGGPLENYRAPQVSKLYPTRQQRTISL